MGQTSLFRAATGMNTGMIDLLAAHGADPNIQDKEGRTVLSAPSGLCQYWNIKALLAHGADRSLRNKLGRTALQPDYVSADAARDPKCAISKRLLQDALSRIH